MRLTVYLAPLAVVTVAVKAQMNQVALGSDSPADSAADSSVDSAIEDAFLFDLAARKKELPFEEFVGEDGLPLRLSDPSSFPTSEDYAVFKNVFEKSASSGQQMNAVDDEDEDDENEDEDNGEDIDGAEDDQDDAIAAEGKGDAADPLGLWKKKKKKHHHHHHHRHCTVQTTITLIPPCTATTTTRFGTLDDPEPMPTVQPPEPMNSLLAPEPVNPMQPLDPVIDLPHEPQPRRVQ